MNTDFVDAPKRIFETANEFSFYIEKYAADNEITCLNALIFFCEENGVDYEDTALMINKQLKDKLAVNFSDLGFLKATPSLY